MRQLFAVWLRRRTCAIRYVVTTRRTRARPQLSRRRQAHRSAFLLRVHSGPRLPALSSVIVRRLFASHTERTAQAVLQSFALTSLPQAPNGVWVPREWWRRAAKLPSWAQGRRLRVARGRTFSVVLVSRWHRGQAAGSFARSRYHSSFGDKVRRKAWLAVVAPTPKQLKAQRKSYKPAEGMNSAAARLASALRLGQTRRRVSYRFQPTATGEGALAGGVDAATEDQLAVL